MKLTIAGDAHASAPLSSAEPSAELASVTVPPVPGTPPLAIAPPELAMPPVLTDTSAGTSAAASELGLIEPPVPGAPPVPVVPPVLVTPPVLVVPPVLTDTSAGRSGEASGLGRKSAFSRPEEA